VEETWEFPPEELSKLTPKRLELLDSLSRMRVDSISELAERVRRDVKNVYLDLKALESLGLITLRRRGRSLIPELSVEELTLLLG
jgi:predicted transcriptional regulator